MPTFLLAVRYAQLDAHNAKVLARIARETSAEARRRNGTELGLR